MTDAPQTLFPFRLRELARSLSGDERRLLYDAAQEILRLEELLEQAEVDTERKVSASMRSWAERLAAELQAVRKRSDAL